MDALALAPWILLVVCALVAGALRLRNRPNTSRAALAIVPQSDAMEATTEQVVVPAGLQVSVEDQRRAFLAQLDLEGRLDFIDDGDDVVTIDAAALDTMTVDEPPSLSPCVHLTFFGRSEWKDGQGATHTTQGRLALDMRPDILDGMRQHLDTKFGLSKRRFVRLEGDERSTFSPGLDRIEMGHVMLYMIGAHVAAQKTAPAGPPSFYFRSKDKPLVVKLSMLPGDVKVFQKAIADLCATIPLSVRQPRLPSLFGSPPKPVVSRAFGQSPAPAVVALLEVQRGK